MLDPQNYFLAPRIITSASYIYEEENKKRWSTILS